MTDLKPNEGKKLRIEFDGLSFERYPVKTHVITKDDNISDVCNKYVKKFLEKDDMLFISERIVAISQGRAYHISEIKPSPFANLLVKFVHKSPYGIGLGSPWTMELAIREAGLFRILFAAFLSAVTKPFGMRGVFYKAVGKNINAIDGPCAYTLPPYNEYAKLGPLNPNKVAKDLQQMLGNRVIIIDANDLGVNILGRSDKSIDVDMCCKVFKDNPLGQSSECTPLCIVRKVS